MTDIETRLRALPSAITLRSEDEEALAKLFVGLQSSASAARPSEYSPRRVRAMTMGAAIAAALIVILQANLVAIYFAPSYGRALADSPGVGPISERLLGAVGLTAGDIAVVGDSATSAGHTLKLVGAYADGLRTVLFVSIDGKGVTGNPKEYGRNPDEWGINFDDMLLTDQFGHSYAEQGIAGPTDLQFQALAWPTSSVGARLTLHVTGIWAMWKVAEIGPNKGIDPETLTMHGDWTLHVTLMSEPAHKLALPAPLHSAQADYTFTSVTASRTEIVLHWTVTGPVNDGMRSAPPPAYPPSEEYQRTMQDYFTPRVYDSAGNELQMAEWGYEWPKTGAAKGQMTVFIKGPGRYRIQQGAALTAPDQQRWIVVP
jgi:hypothetical protein